MHQPLSSSLPDALLLRALDATSNGVLITDPRQQGNPIIYCNRAFQEITGYGAGEVLGRSCRFLQGEDTNPGVCAEIRLALAAGRDCRVTLLNYRKDGTPFWNELSISPIRDADGCVTHFVGVQADVTERRAEEQERQGAEKMLQETNEWLRLALRGGGLASGIADVTTRQFLHISETYKAHFGLSPDAEFSLDALVRTIHPEDLAKVRKAFQRSIQECRDYQATYRVIWPDGSIHWLSADGTPLYDAMGQPSRMIGVVKDITRRIEWEVQQARTLREAEERADCDPLTGLWNHRAFHRRLEAAQAEAQRLGTSLAVAMLDLDNFGFFNKAYGHVVGDNVLRVVAERLLSVCCPHDTVARFGGDEFALLMPDVGKATCREIEARLTADLDGLNYCPTESESEIPLGISMGIALFPDDEAAHPDVLLLADERLRRAKAGAPLETEADQVRLRASSQVAGFPMLDALVTAVDNKDRYTRRHSEGVMEYSLMIAHELELNESARRVVAWGALLHDVGKIGVPDAVLRKPAPLTGHEREAVKQHPTMGAALVSTVPGLEDILDVVRHHHERWDGRGYPGGLRGEETPLIARLMAVADAFSAMTTDRPYRKRMEHGKALAILADGAGKQWDPQCVEALLTAWKRMQEHASAA